MSMLTPAQGRMDAWQWVDFDFAFTLYEDDAGTTPLDLTGYTAEYVAAPRGSSPAVISLTGAELTMGGVAGSITGHVDGATMGTYRAGQWEFQLRLIDPDGKPTLPIEGLLVATHTANIPTGTSRVLGFGYLLIKSVGTTARTVDFDYVDVHQTFTSAR